MVVSFGHGTEPSGSVKVGICKLIEGAKLLKKDSLLVVSPLNAYF